MCRLLWSLVVHFGGAAYSPKYVGYKSNNSNFISYRGRLFNLFAKLNLDIAHLLTLDVGIQIAGLCVSVCLSARPNVSHSLLSVVLNIFCTN